MLFAASACVEPVPEFRLDTDAIEIGAEGGDVCVSLDSPEAWIAKTQDPWITVTPANGNASTQCTICLLYTSPSPRDKRQSRMPSSA